MYFDFSIFFHLSVYLGVYCLYWFQYSLNFFIYAARGGQYRKAYKYFLIQVKYVNSYICCSQLQYIYSIFSTTHFISITQMKQSICGKSSEIPNNQLTITNSNTNTTISKRLQLVRKLIFEHFSIFQNAFFFSVIHNGRF